MKRPSPPEPPYLDPAANRAANHRQALVPRSARRRQISVQRLLLSHLAVCREHRTADRFSVRVVLSHWALASPGFENGSAAYLSPLVIVNQLPIQQSGDVIHGAHHRPIRAIDLRSTVEPTV